MKKARNSRETKTAVFAKIGGFGGERARFVARDDIRIEHAREYGERVKYATFDGNGYSHETRIGYVLDARIYVRDFDFCWLSATYGEGTGTIKGERVEIRAHTGNLQDSISEFEIQKIGA